MKGQKMIQTLARKRTQLGALAVLAGLVVALFAVFQSVQAAPALTIVLNDSDNVVKAGAGYTVNVTVKDTALAAGSQDVTSSYTLEYITVTGGVFLANVVTDGNLNSNTDTNNNEATLVVPPGAAGVYTITAGVIDPDGNTATSPPSAVRVVGTLEVTVGDVGTPIGSVEVVLGKVFPAGADGAGNFNIGTDAVPNPATDSATKRMGSNIAVTVNVLNSLGNKPNASEVSQVLLFVPAGTADNDTSATDGSPAGSPTANSATAGADPGVSENFFVSKATSGTVDVYAVAIGTGGTATSSSITLTFTGDADTIALGDASSPLATTSILAGPGPDGTAGNEDDVEASGHATVKITAVDSAGNKAALDASAADPPVVTGLSFAFKDADGDPVTGKFNTALAQAPKAGDTTCVDTAGDANTCDGTTVILTLTTTDAAPGTYTLEATFNQKEAVTTEIVVSGPPAAIELSSSHDTVELGNIVTITATVTDKDGHAVTNENSVTFVAVGSLELTALDSLNPSTKHGEAKIRYVVTKGSGTATIIASDAADGGTADAVIAVSMAAADAAEAEVEEISAANCLSSTNAGPASWTCEGGSDASAIFPALQSRGATALWLWNGSSWLRYSLRDGAEIPGSTDFMIQNRDNLWISY